MRSLPAASPRTSPGAPARGSEPASTAPPVVDGLRFPEERVAAMHTSRLPNRHLVFSLIAAVGPPISIVGVDCDTSLGRSRSTRSGLAWVGRGDSAFQTSAGPTPPAVPCNPRSLGRPSLAGITSNDRGLIEAASLATFIATASSTTSSRSRFSATTSAGIRRSWTSVPRHCSGHAPRRSNRPPRRCTRNRRCSPDRRRTTFCTSIASSFLTPLPPAAFVMGRVRAAKLRIGQYTPGQLTPPPPRRGHTPCGRHPTSQFVISARGALADPRSKALYLPLR